MAYIYEKCMYLKLSLFNNEAVSGINDVMDFTYLKILRIVLIAVNAWPGKEIGEKWPKHMNFISYGYLITYVLFTYLLATYFIKNISGMNAFDFGTSLIYFLAETVYVTRAFTMLTKKYKDTVALFITEFHLFYFKHVSAYAMEIHQKVHQISYKLTVFIFAEIVFGNFALNGMMLYNNYQAGNFEHRHLVNSTYELAVHLSSPFKHETNLYGFIGMCLFIWIVVVRNVIVYYIIDFLLIFMIIHLWGHLKILLHNLETFPLPANKTLLAINDEQTVNVDMYNEEELIIVHQRLKECINHHRLIKKCINNISDAFGVMLAQYMIFYLIIGCLLLFVSSVMNQEQLMRIAQILVGIFQQLIIMSFIFELLGSTSEKLSDAVYAIPWECMDTKNRKTVWIFLMNVQKPLRIKALGLVDIGASTMVSILKTSFSYFTFLRTLQFSDQTN